MLTFEYETEELGFVGRSNDCIKIKLRLSQQLGKRNHLVQLKVFCLVFVGGVVVKRTLFGEKEIIVKSRDCILFLS